MGMDVSPQHLREVVFKQAWRGYDEDEVDDFLDQVAAGIEGLQQQLRKAQERALDADQRAVEAAQADDDLRRTLLMAQRAADLAVQEAEQNAARTVAEAERESRRLVADAEIEARRVRSDSERELRREIDELNAEKRRLQNEIGTLQQYVDLTKGRLRDLLSGQLARLDQAADLLPPPPPLAEVGPPTQPVSPVAAIPQP